MDTERFPRWPSHRNNSAPDLRDHAGRTLPSMTTRRTSASTTVGDDVRRCRD